MKTKLFVFSLTVVALLAATHPATAQGTAFTYQGRLNNGGTPANGTYDLVFTVFASASGLNDSFANQTNSATSVSNGLFTVTLNLGDPNIFTGTDRWLEIEVRTNGTGGYAKLSPRQKITPTPYAITAGNVVSNGLAGNYANAVTFSNTANTFRGAFFGNGAGLSNVTAVATNAWRLDGNAGTTAGAHFIGTTDNQALALKVNNVIALQFTPGTTLPNLVGGLGSFRPSFLTPGVSGAVIVGGNAPSGAVNGGGGGDFHAVYDNDGTVGGGFGNKAGSNNGDITDGAFATVAGGVFNSAANYAATVAGGDGNFAGGQRSFVGGGYGNQAQASFSVAGGGLLNFISASADYAVIGGGDNNSIGAFSTDGTIGGGSHNMILSNPQSATISGGYGNRIQTNANASTIGGGYANLIQTNGIASTVGGGEFNTIEADSFFATVGGGYNNTIQANAYDSTIGGGEFNAIQPGADHGTIGGGYANRIQTHAVLSTIAGGDGNKIYSDADHSTIGGGLDNNIGADSSNATIAGGFFNSIGTNSGYSVIGGGYSNNVASDLYSATIAGGFFNSIGTNASTGAIGGGYRNSVADGSDSATVAGGTINRIAINCPFSTIGGGYGNNVAANSRYATIPGGLDNFAVNYAFAAGRRAGAVYQGSFVWADSNDFDFFSTATNKVRFRCTGGFDIITAIDGLGNQTAGVYVPSGGSGWLTVSDRNAKESFQPVNGQEVLAKVAAMPMTTWKYKSQAEGIRHIGVMAQDFHAAFQVGENERCINTVDADGVALAAIQGLNEKLEEELKRRDVENAELKSRLAVLEKLVAKLSEKGN